MQGDFLASKPIHAIKIAFMTFVISLVISYLSGFSMELWLSITILFLVILVGVGFDVIGTAVTAAEEMPLHAMAADKVHGSREAIYLIRHADRVANFCNDVVGDIAGTVSGGIVAGIVIQVINQTHPAVDLINATAIALIAALTVGGKSFGKSYAIHQANAIVFFVGKVLSFTKLVNTDLKKNRRKNRSNLRKAKKSNG
jgi:CBS domain containing-hemolysin-like protein